MRRSAYLIRGKVEVPSTMRTSEPFVSIPEDVIPKMLELASLKPGETVFDLGSGDGRITIFSARDFHAKAIGVEVRSTLVRKSLKRIHQMGLSRQIRILRCSFREVDLSKADVLALYLASYTLSTLVSKFRKELKPNTRIVTFDFSIPGWTPVREISIIPAGWRKAHPIYLYKCP